MVSVRERMDEVEELLGAGAVVDACVRAGYWGEAIDVAKRLEEVHQRMLHDPVPVVGMMSRSGSRRGGIASIPSTPAAMSRTPTLTGTPAGSGALVLLTRVRNEVSVALLSLRARVLDSLLQRSLKLPGAVRGISILRRMNDSQNFGGMGVVTGEGDEKKTGEMGEEALRIVFLAARWKCLRAELQGPEAQMIASGIKLKVDSEGQGGKKRDGVEVNVQEVMDEEEGDLSTVPEENEERTRWIKRWIEVWREVVGETVGIYSEVFLSPTYTLSSSKPLFLATPTAAPNTTSLTPTVPLTLFLSLSLTHLSKILSSSLPFLTSPSSLSSLLTQLSYCSHSFARYGLGFLEFAQIRELVENRVGNIVKMEWERSGQRWEAEWREIWDATEGSSAAPPSNARRGSSAGQRRAPVSLHEKLVVQEGLPTLFSTPLPTTLSPWNHLPPSPLSLLFPLRHFLNSHSTTLNSLRLLPSISLLPRLLVTQAKILNRASQILNAFVEAWLGQYESISSLLSPPFSADDKSPDQLEEERTKKEERRVLIFVVAAFGRWVIPWCEGALKLGVYGEYWEGVVLKQMKTSRKEEEGGEEEGMQEREGKVLEAVARMEELLRRLEGRKKEIPFEVPVVEETEEAEKEEQVVVEKEVI